MTSGNHVETPVATRETTSGNTVAGEVPIGGEQLSVAMAAELARYQRALATAPLSPDTRRKYAARVRGFLVWLETSGLATRRGREGAAPVVPLRRVQRPVADHGV